VKYVVLALALFGCAAAEPPTPECIAILEHMVQISPAGAGKDAKAVVAALPVEDFQGCGATDEEIRACMMKAADPAAVKSCVPRPAILGCMHTALKARKQARKQAGGDVAKANPELDKRFDEIRARCWAGDENAAANLKLD
jgi:hypothetical protein